MAEDDDDLLSGVFDAADLARWKETERARRVVELHELLAAAEEAFR